MFKLYRKRKTLEARPYRQGEDEKSFLMCETDRRAGSPREGDMLAKRGNKLVLITEQDFAHYIEVAE